MDASAIGDIYTRLTRIEDRLDVNVSQLAARLDALEQAEQRRAAEQEQARRDETAELRNQVAQLQSLIKEDAARSVKAGAPAPKR